MFSLIGSALFTLILLKYELIVIEFVLRHSHASILLKEKIPIKAISERLGHSNVNITLNLYSHTYQETNQEIANKFDKILQNG